MIPALSAFLSERLLDRAGGHRARVLNAFRRKARTERLPQSEREEIQAQHLVRLLSHARDHVAHWAPFLKGFASIEPARAVEVLRTLPLMQRADVQRDGLAFRSDVPGPVFDDATGGSTGTPMQFKVDRPTQVARESSLMWADSLAGWAPGEKIAMLWGSDRDVASAAAGRRLALRWWIENRRWYNAFEMGEAQMRRFHEELESFQPHLLVAYTSAAFTFARFLKRQGWKPWYPLRAIITSAEVLTSDMRATVEGVFGRPVHDRYGNREFGALAAECEAHDGLHLNESDALIEVDSPDPFAVPGRILVTHLHNYAMPFLRYDTGDVGVLVAGETCACGRTTRRLRQVAGRTSDMIRALDGTIIHGEFFTHLLYGADGLQQFQFVQESADAYTLAVVADRARTASQEMSWRRRILEKLGGAARLDIRYVERIPETASGKRRFTISKLPPP